MLKSTDPHPAGGEIKSTLQEKKTRSNQEPKNSTINGFSPTLGAPLDPGIDRGSQALPMQAPVITSAGWWSFSRTREAAIQKAKITGLNANLPRILGISWGPKKMEIHLGHDGDRFDVCKIYISTKYNTYYNQAYWDMDTPLVFGPIPLKMILQVLGRADTQQVF